MSFRPGANMVPTPVEHRAAMAPELDQQRQIVPKAPAQPDLPPPRPPTPTPPGPPDGLRDPTGSAGLLSSYAGGVLNVKATAHNFTTKAIDTQLSRTSEFNQQLSPAGRVALMHIQGNKGLHTAVREGLAKAATETSKTPKYVDPVQQDLADAQYTTALHTAFRDSVVDKVKNITGEEGKKIRDAIGLNAEGTVSDPAQFNQFFDGVVEITAVAAAIDVSTPKGKDAFSVLKGAFFSFKGPDGKSYGGYDWGTFCKAFSGQGTPGENKGLIGAWAGTHAINLEEELNKRKKPDDDDDTNASVTVTPAGAEVHVAPVVTPEVTVTPAGP